MARIITTTEGGKIMPARFTTQNLQFKREDLTGCFLARLVADVLVYSQDGKKIFCSLFVNDLSSRWEYITELQFEEYFNEFAQILTTVMDDTVLQDDLTRLTQTTPHYCPKAQWIVERKEIRGHLNALFEKHFSNSVIPQTEHRLRRDLKNCLVERFNHTIVLMNHIIDDYRLGRLVEIFDFPEIGMTKTQRIKLASRNISLAYAKEVCTLVQHIVIPPVYRKSILEASEILLRWKKSLFEYFLRNHAEICGSDISFGKYANTIRVIRDLFNSKDIYLYLDSRGNDIAILTRIHDCIKNQKMILATMTCPDYSGYYEGEGNEKTWVFDFRELNSGDGIVAQKAYPFITTLYRIFSMYIADLSIRHDLPTMEFPTETGFKNGYLSKTQTTDILKQSLKVIKSKYKDMYNLDVSVGLSAQIIPDELFEKMRLDMMPVLKVKYTTDFQFKKFVDFVFKQRSSMYKKWYPRLEHHVSADQYKEYLMDCVYSQIADYWNDVVAYTQNDSVFMAYADSPVLSGVWSFANAPALSGQGQSVVGYRE